MLKEERKENFFFEYHHKGESSTEKKGVQAPATPYTMIRNQKVEPLLRYQADALKRNP
jgi:hypothetical protein